MGESTDVEVADLRIEDAFALLDMMVAMLLMMLLDERPEIVKGMG